MESVLLRDSGYSVYCVAIVTIFDCTPPIVTMTGVAAPVVMREGTTALTWYKPMNVGASPEKLTLADAPPIVTVGMLVVVDVFVAVAPLAGGFSTGPKPVM